MARHSFDEDVLGCQRYRQFRIGGDEKPGSVKASSPTAIEGHEPNQGRSEFFDELAIVGRYFDPPTVKRVDWYGHGENPQRVGGTTPANASPPSTPSPFLGSAGWNRYPIRCATLKTRRHSAIPHPPALACARAFVA